MAAIVLADSITRVAESQAAGAVVVNASHGGIYAAYLAAKLDAAAAIFNDAGIGRDRAGIGGLDYLQDLGIAAAGRRAAARDGRAQPADGHRRRRDARPVTDAPGGRQPHGRDQKGDRVA